MTASHSLVDEMLDRDDPVTNAIRDLRARRGAEPRRGRPPAAPSNRMTELNAWDHEARVQRAPAPVSACAIIEQPVNTLSGGQQKRLAMAKVLINACPMC
jgi:ATP-binding cassette subfamily F protein uup